MLSSWYQRKFLKKLDHSLKWCNRLKHRDRLWCFISLISFLPIQIRYKLNSNANWGWIGIRYLKLSDKLLHESDNAHSDYLHQAKLNNAIAGKFLNRIERQDRNRNEVKKYD